LAGNDHRKEKKREKKRTKRRSAQSKRGSRKVLGMAADKMERARRWPMWDCWVSQGWDEQGATVHCCFARRHDDGRIAAAFFELDLLENGVLSVTARSPVTPSEVHAELGRRGGEDAALMSCEPALVVKPVESARDHGDSRGHRQPSGLKRARRLFGSITGRKSPYDVVVGVPDPNAPAKAKKEGWFAGLKNRLGRG
jgi:hypothetical protein